MKFSLIIPVYNEEEILEEVCMQLNEFMSKNYDDYEIIFANDGSLDATLSIIKQLKQKYPNVRYVSYEKNRGKGCAVKTGMLASTGEYAIFTDCDLAYGIEIIKTFSDTLIKTGADVVIGSRKKAKDGYAGYSFARAMMSKMYLKLLSLLTGFSQSDSQSGIKGFEGGAAKELFSKCETDGFAFDIEILIMAEKSGMIIEEVPVKILNNRERDSKISPLKDAFKMLKDVKRIKKRVKNYKKTS